MVPSPWERRSFLRGMRQGGAVAREMSLGNQVRTGQWGATSRTCSSSSLSLHNVCASRLTGGNAYLRKARGQLCASASVPRGPSFREKYSWHLREERHRGRARLWAAPRSEKLIVCWPPARCSRLPGQAWPSALGLVRRWRQHQRGQPHRTFILRGHEPIPRCCDRHPIYRWRT